MNCKARSQGICEANITEEISRIILIADVSFQVDFQLAEAVEYVSTYSLRYGYEDEIYLF